MHFPEECWVDRFSAQAPCWQGKAARRGELLADGSQLVMMLNVSCPACGVRGAGHLSVLPDACCMAMLWTHNSLWAMPAVSEGLHGTACSLEAWQPGCCSLVH